MHGYSTRSALPGTAGGRTKLTAFLHRSFNETKLCHNTCSPLRVPKEPLHS